MWKNYWFYFIVNDKNIQLAGRAINHLKTTDFNCINYKSHRFKMMSENFSESPYKVIYYKFLKILVQGRLCFTS